MAKRKIQLVYTEAELDRTLHDQSFHGDVAVNVTREPALKIKLWPQLQNPNRYYHYQNRHGTNFRVKSLFGSYVLYGRAA